jgi:hypothetical protein
VLLLLKCYPNLYFVLLIMMSLLKFPWCKHATGSVFFSNLYFKEKKKKVFLYTCLHFCCCLISKTLLGFHFFAVKKLAQSIQLIYISSLSYTNNSRSCFHFWLHLVSDLFYSSFYCCTARSAVVDFCFFPRLAPLATQFCIHATWMKAGQSDWSGIKNRWT